MQYLPIVGLGDFHAPTSEPTVPERCLGGGYIIYIYTHIFVHLLIKNALNFSWSIQNETMTGGQWPVAGCQGDPLTIRTGPVLPWAPLDLRAVAGQSGDRFPVCEEEHTPTWLSFGITPSSCG